MSLHNVVTCNKVMRSVMCAQKLEFVTILRKCNNTIEM